jgi:hypothetical protein
MAAALLVGALTAAVVTGGLGDSVAGGLRAAICEVMQEQDCHGPAADRTDHRARPVAADRPERPRSHWRQQQREVISCTDWLWIDTIESEWGGDQR